MFTRKTKVLAYEEREDIRLNGFISEMESIVTGIFVQLQARQKKTTYRGGCDGRIFFFHFFPFGFHPSFSISSDHLMDLFTPGGEP